METADEYLRRGGECAAVAWAERDPLDARLFRAFATEFLARADELERDGRDGD